MNKIFIDFFIEDITKAIVINQMKAEDMSHNDMVDISLFGYHLVIAFFTLMGVALLFASVFHTYIFAAIVITYAVVNTLISYKGLYELKKEVKKK